MGMGIIPGKVICKDCSHLMPFVHADEAGVYLAPTVCSECKSKNVAFQFDNEQPLTDPISGKPIMDDEFICGACGEVMPRNFNWGTDCGVKDCHKNPFKKAQPSVSSTLKEGKE